MLMVYKYIYYIHVTPGGRMMKDPLASGGDTRDLGSVLVGEVPGEKWQPTAISYPE